MSPIVRTPCVTAACLCNGRRAAPWLSPSNRPPRTRSRPRCVNVVDRNTLVWWALLLVSLLLAVFVTPCRRPLLAGGVGHRRSAALWIRQAAVVRLAVAHAPQLPVDAQHVRQHHRQRSRPGLQPRRRRRAFPARKYEHMASQLQLRARHGHLRRRMRLWRLAEILPRRTRLQGRGHQHHAGASPLRPARVRPGSAHDELERRAHQTPSFSSSSTANSTRSRSWTRSNTT